MTAELPFWRVALNDKTHPHYKIAWYLFDSTFDLEFAAKRLAPQRDEAIAFALRLLDEKELYVVTALSGGYAPVNALELLEYWQVSEAAPRLMQLLVERAFREAEMLKADRLAYAARKEAWQAEHGGEFDENEFEADYFAELDEAVDENSLESRQIELDEVIDDAVIETIKQCGTGVLPQIIALYEQYPTHTHLHRRISHLLYTLGAGLPAAGEVLKAYVLHDVHENEFLLRISTGDVLRWDKKAGRKILEECYRRPEFQPYQHILRETLKLFKK